MKWPPQHPNHHSIWIQISTMPSPHHCHKGELAICCHLPMAWSRGNNLPPIFTPTWTMVLTKVSEHVVRFHFNFCYLSCFWTLFQFIWLNYFLSPFESNILAPKLNLSGDAHTNAQLQTVAPTKWSKILFPFFFVCFISPTTINSLK